MELQHIPLDRLSVSKLNMRHARKAPDVSDLLPSIRARGVQQPLLVRRNDKGRFEIVAGRRRYFSLKAIAKETGEAAPVPCAIMADGDDCTAIEASLLENFARLSPHKMENFETFARLIKEGQQVEDIATMFGLPVLAVKRILKLGNLLPAIRKLYKEDAIDGETVQLLTMATRAVQKKWLALIDDPDAYAPQGYQLKSWILGSERLTAANALFPVEDYKGRIITDLFGEEDYFADADQFWELQNAAIAKKRDAYLEDGWTDVTVFAPGEGPGRWELAEADKADGGKVFLYVGRNGKVEISEGVLTQAEKRRLERKRSGAGDDAAPKTERPELTQKAQNFIELQRHAAVRHALLDEPGVALRLMVAHVIGGSSLWRVDAEPQRALSESIDGSVKTSPAQALFEDARKSALTLIGRPEGNTPLASGRFDELETATVFARLLELTDDQVIEILACVMGETLASGSALVELLGNHLSVDMAHYYDASADEVFLDLVRDRQVVREMISEVVSRRTADKHLTATLKVQKEVLRKAVAKKGKNKTKPAWCPRYFRFPIATYTPRDSFPIVEGWKRVSGLFKSAK